MLLAAGHPQNLFLNRKMVRGPIAARRARNAAILAEAEQLAAAHQPRHARLPVVLLPVNARSITELPDDARERFLLHLRLQITRAFSEPLRDSAAGMPREEQGARLDADEIEGPDADSDATVHGAILGAGCATCLGECCTAGGTHAFLKTASLVRVRAHLAGLGEHVTPASIEAKYRSALPAQHYHGSCVFHAVGGCTLPRVLRSNLCNRYLCGGLTQLSRALTARNGTAAIVAAADSVQLRRLARVSNDGVEPLPLRTM